MKNKFIKLSVILNIYIGLLLSFDMHADRIIDITKSYDGKIYITADKSGQINIWDSSNNKIINSYNIDLEDELYNISISPNKQLLAVSFDDGKISIIDINNNISKIFNLKDNLENNNRFKMIKFINNIELISYQDDQNSIKFWELISKENIFGIDSKVMLSEQFEGPSDTYIMSTKINNNNRIILSRLKNKNFAKWDIE